MISATSSSSAVDQAEVADQLGLDFLLAQDVDDVDIHLPGQQVAQRVLVAMLVQEVGDHHDDPFARVPDRELLGRRGQVALSRRGQSCSRYWMTRHICERPRTLGMP